MEEEIVVKRKGATMKYDYDLIVIGGGSAGLSAAGLGNALGAHVCLIEKRKLGGDCTWYGCVPSKALLKSASIFHHLKTSEHFGITSGHEPAPQTGSVLSHVRDVINTIAADEQPEILEKNGISVIIGDPQFLDAETIEVNGKKLQARKFIICTGSHPLVLPIEGLERTGYLTNETVFNLPAFPASLLVLGGGPIGVELSQALNRLGVKITLIEMMDKILFREDEEIAKIVAEQLADEGIKIITGKKAVKFEKKNNLVFASVEDKNGNREEIAADNVLVAVGRAPNLAGLSLEKAGIGFDKKGIKVNAFLQTTNKNIFACGDVVGHYLFSHVASYQAQICARNALFRRIAWQKTNYSTIAWATFTEPELAHLGLTEEEARMSNRGIKVYKTAYAAVNRAITDGAEKGLIKIITDKKNYIIGAHIAGAQAAEIMQGFLIAKSLKIPLPKLASVLFIYPTLSELVRKIAAQPLRAKAGQPFIKAVLKLLRQ